MKSDECVFYIESTLHSKHGGIPEKGKHGGIHGGFSMLKCCCTSFCGGGRTVIFVYIYYNLSVMVPIIGQTWGSYDQTH